MILVLSCAVLLITIWCLSQGITIIFMHLYYLPIVLLAYHYRKKGLYLSVLLSLSYFALVAAYGPDDLFTIEGAGIRSIVFIGVAALVAYLSEQLVQAHKALDRTAHIQQGIIQNTNVWLMVLDSDGRILEWNTAAEDISGFVADEVIRKNEVWKQLYPDKNYRKEITGKITEIIRKENYLENLKTVITCKDGTKKTLMWNTKILPQEEKGTPQYIAIGVDVTATVNAEYELKKAYHQLTAKEEELRERYEDLARSRNAILESEAEYRNILKTAIDGFSIVDSTGSFLDVNDAFCTMTGYSRNELLTLSLLHIEAKEQHEEIASHMSEIIRKGADRFETNYRKKDGGIINVEVSVIVSETHGRHFVVFHHEITERKRAEKVLQKSEEQFRILAEQSRDIICTIDLNESLTFVSPSVKKILGYEPDEVIGKNAFDFIFHNDRQKGLDAFKSQVIEKGQIQVVAVELVRKDGSHVPVEFTLAPVYKEGTLAEVLISGRDITERKKAEAALAESEEKFRGVAERSSDIIQLTDRTGRITFVSPSIKRILGFDPDEVIGTLPDDLVHPDDIGAVHELIRKNVAGSLDVEGMETRVRKKGGGYAILDISVSPVIKEGVLSGMQVVGRDITDRKQAEMERDKLVSVIRHSSEFISLATPDRKIIFINDAGADMLGVRPEDVIGQDFMLCVPDHQKESVQSEVLPSFMKNGHWEGDLQYRNVKTGNLIDVHAMNFVIGDPVTGAPQFLATVSRDITGRKQAEKKLRESERRLSLAIEGSDIGIWDWDVPTMRIDYNDRQVVMLGYTPDEFGNDVNRFMQIIHPDDLPGFSGLLNDCITGTLSVFSSEIRLRHRDNTWVWVLARGSVAERDMNGKAARISGTHLDITERKQAELVLEVSEKKFHTMVDFTADWEYWQGQDKQIIYTSPSCERFTGYTQQEFLADSHLLVTIVHPDDLASVKEHNNSAWETRKALSTDFRIIHRDGTVRWISHACRQVYDDERNALGRRVSNRDITFRKNAEAELKKYADTLEEMVNERTKELREAQEQLVIKEKLAVLGKLAGGVGHELRNPLGAIKNAAYFLNMVLENPEPDVKETLEIMNKEITRSEDILSSLLDFARPTVLTPRKVRINDVINEAVTRNPIPENIKVVRNPDDTLPVIMADPDKLLQVFTNLVTNACQAMPGGGSLTLQSALSGESRVSVSVTDTGVGISEENMKRIFEPLFSTKAKGIGLGLVVTKAIVEAHNGSIDIRSEAGKGTTFTVTLPVGIKGWQ
ncbi:MAG: PAS domain S-box protein [Methanoregula sp.]|nr:PAS domain S-box protein [Methanoregula sp.]